uniref:Uncharacterized protein n=1 Tax=Glycine max TaxID=3847 RepID=I1JPK2_SOYBN
MADNEQPNNEEASPLLHQPHPQPKSEPPTPPETPEFLLGWTADGLPLAHASVVGQPMGRAPWNSSICACLGQNDHFCSSDLEVFLGVWLLVCCMEAMLRDLDLLVGHLPITACLILECI